MHFSEKAQRSAARFFTALRAEKYGRNALFRESAKVCRSFFHRLTGGKIRAKRTFPVEERKQTARFSPPYGRRNPGETHFSEKAQRSAARFFTALRAEKSGRNANYSSSFFGFGKDFSPVGKGAFFSGSLRRNKPSGKSGTFLSLFGHNFFFK